MDKDKRNAREHCMPLKYGRYSVSTVWCGKILPLFCFVTFFISGSTTTHSEFDRLKNEIIRNLKWFSDTLKYHDYEAAGIDIDSLATSTELQLQALLTFKESMDLNLSEFPNLKLAADTHDMLQIRLYYFSHVVGPTGYEDVHTVCQWRNKKGRLLSHGISSKIPGTIVRIHNLRSNAGQLYLLQSQDFSNTIVYIIQFRGSYLLLDYPAFVTVPNIILKNAYVSFMPEKQTLAVRLYDDNTAAEAVIDPMVDKARDSESYKRIIEYFKDKRSVNFTFNGLQFLE